MERTPPGASRLYPSQGTPCETSAQLQSLQRGGPPSRWISPARPVSDSSTLPDMFAGASTWLEDPLKVLRQRKLLGSLSSAILGPQQSHRGDSREGTGWAPAVRGLGAPNLTPEGGLGLRWLVSGWRRGSVPNNKFDLRPFAVAQHMGQIDPASCPFCAERRMAIRFLREEKNRLDKEISDILDSTHTDLRDSLREYQEQHLTTGDRNGPSKVLSTAAAKLSAAAAAAAAAAAEALSGAISGASCRGPQSAYDFDELLPGTCLPWEGPAAAEAAKPEAAAAAAAYLHGGAFRRPAVPGAPGGLMGTAASLLSLGSSVQLTASDSAVLGGPLGGPMAAAATPGPPVGGQEALCRECADTAASVSFWRDEVDKLERSCQLAIQFHTDRAELVEAVLVSSYRADDSSNRDCGRRESGASCDSEISLEDEPQARKLNGETVLLVTGPRIQQQQLPLLQ
ncbi:hypothetical protein, conserved [Eimeria tenella]|uniref:Uncharacterized protein n=1 Tax=Eimeria tenella TaxID=5802 RepID=U6LC74_EIMTE|nr:hypothetical protein, conserved [Eimeria tenella]CDJ45350.1 hypothetical protein, conserved [Eimeria tenella]|eukprot:XP_013236096.1 hypothetical protein, conserved [Eimeria tenella]